MITRCYTFYKTANTVAEETKSCFQLLLTTVARENKAARAVIKEKGGDNLAR